jgi:hypothetical protein
LYYIRTKAYTGNAARRQAAPEGSYRGATSTVELPPDFFIMEGMAFIAPCLAEFHQV